MSEKRDGRSFRIKKRLAQAFPANHFKVRIDKYAGGESINIHTDLIEKLSFDNAVWRVHANANPSEQDQEEARAYDAKLKANRENEERIKRLVGEFESVDYDDFSGEVLQGGNTFMFIHHLENSGSAGGRSE